MPTTYGCQASCAGQVEFLVQRPEIDLVFSDMYSIDADGRRRSAHPVSAGRVRRRSALCADPSHQRRLQQFAGVPVEPVHRPAPQTICDWDWWLALCAARAGAIGYIAEPLAEYRQHGANMLAGAAGPKLVALRRRQLRFQLWTFRHLSLEPLRPVELLEVWGGAEWFVATAKQAVGSHFLDLISVTDDDRVARRTRLGLRPTHASAAGDLGEAARLRLRALAWDPLDPEGLAELRSAVASAHALAA